MSALKSGEESLGGGYPAITQCMTVGGFPGNIHCLCFSLRGQYQDIFVVMPLTDYTGVSGGFPSTYA